VRFNARGLHLWPHALSMGTQEAPAPDAPASWHALEGPAPSEKESSRHVDAEDRGRAAADPGPCEDAQRYERLTFECVSVCVPVAAVNPGMRR
jgi:hypothetical protein